MPELKGITLLSLIFVVAGAINWGLIGVFQLDLIGLLLGGSDSLLSRLAYTVIGIAGMQLLSLFQYKKAKSK